MHHKCKLKYFEPPTFSISFASPPCMLLLFFSIELKLKLSKALRCECAEFPPAHRLFRLLVLASYSFINISSHLRFLLPLTPNLSHFYSQALAKIKQLFIYLILKEILFFFLFRTYSSFSTQHS